MSAASASGAKAHDEGLVSLLVEDALGVGDGDGLIGRAVLLHGRARVDEDAGADGKVAEGFEEDGATGWVAVVEQAQLVEAEVVDGEAVSIGGVKSDLDLVNGDFEVVGL